MKLQQFLPAYDATRSGIKLVARPIRSGELDILAGLEMLPLVVTGPTGSIVASFTPIAPWTHESLRSRLDQCDTVCLVDGERADAYLGNNWIGGTEV